MSAWWILVSFVAGAGFSLAVALLIHRTRTPRVKVNVRCILTVDEMKRLAFRHANESTGAATPAELEVFGWTLARRMMALSFPSEVWIDDRKIELSPGPTEVAEEYHP